MGVVSTDPAQCRDCYRCVRACPVKAVRVHGAQAEVISELCIACANCVRECPQGAKRIEDHLGRLDDALAAGRPVYASIAPSAPAFFELRSFAQLRALLMEAGFAGVEETALGAEMVGRAHGQLIRDGIAARPLLASACPAFVSLVEQYYPTLIPHLAPIVSPMVAHGRWLKQRYGQDAAVVFIGPCVAKKAEVDDKNVAGSVDAALLFSELRGWLRARGLVTLPEPLADQPAAPQHAGGMARGFPVEGGLVRVAGKLTDSLNSSLIIASGMPACQEVLESMKKGELEADLIELMACPGGCVNGPGMPAGSGPFVNRQKVISFLRDDRPYGLPAEDEWPDLTRGYNDRSMKWPAVPEEAIREILAKIDKLTPEDELNCGCCGYNSCRDKAIATYRGMAELTMCIPYMRRRAESLNNMVMDVTPNAVLVVDSELRIQGASQSVEPFFGEPPAKLQGRLLSTVLPAIDDFILVRDTRREIIDHVMELRPDMVVEKTVVPAEDGKFVIGIFRDVTQEVRGREDLARLRGETLHRTQEVIEKQMRVAHEIASLLGETTAETKVLLTKLKQVLEQAEHSTDAGRPPRPGGAGG